MKLVNNQFGSQINISKNNNLFYENQINTLQKQLNQEKNKNQQLINENTKLKNIIKDLELKISIMKKNEDKIKILENEIIKKNKEIENYKSNINTFNNNNNLGFSITSIKPGEKIMTINFVSMGIQDIGHYSLPCKNTDLFVRLEERLYQDYPKFKNYETYFEAKTKRIKRFKTLEENKIDSNDIINIFIIE